MMAAMAATAMFTFYPLEQGLRLPQRGLRPYRRGVYLLSIRTRIKTQTLSLERGSGHGEFTFYPLEQGLRQELVGHLTSFVKFTFYPLEQGLRHYTASSEPKLKQFTFYPLEQGLRQALVEL